MNVVDPAGLLQRVPELAPIASATPQVSEALRSGRPHKVYRALWWADLLGRLPMMHREQAKNLLKQRHLFLEPITGAPGLFTLNGVGVRVYGTGNTPDGLEMGVHFFVVLFVPIFPFAAYLYQQDGKQYRFFGKVPLGSITWVWKNLAASALGLGLLGAGYGVFYASRYQDVIVLNALSEAVDVEIGTRRVHVEPSSRAEVEAEVGVQHVVVHLRDESVLEEGDLNVFTGRDVLAWNVGGLAPAYLETAVYQAIPQDNPPPEIYCGQQAIALSNVDFVFEPLPESVSIPKGSGSATRRHFDVVSYDWTICARWANSGEAEPVELARIVSALESAPMIGEGLPYSLAIRLSTSTPSETADALAKVVQGRDDLPIHRAWQTAMQYAGRTAELLPIYKARYEASPDSLDAAYLYARILPAAEAVVLADAGLAKSPEHVDLLRVHAYSSYLLRRFEDAARDMVVARTKAPERVDELRWLWIEVNAALGRPEVAAELCGAQESFDEDLYVACRRLAALSGTEVPDAAPEGAPAALRASGDARLGLPVDPEIAATVEDPARLAILVSLQTGPEAALALFQGQPDLHPANLDEESALAVFGAAVVAGDAASAERLCNPLGRGPGWVGLLTLIERGEITPELDDATLPTRAVAELMRSRMPGLAAAERARLRAEAQRDDLLHGLVHLALERWKG